MAKKNTEGYAAKPKNAVYNSGQEIRTLRAKMEIAAADDDGQQHILARGISLGYTVLSLMLPKGHGAVTGGTDYDIGLGYLDEDGDIVAVEKDVFVDGIDLSSALTTAKDICESSSSLTIGELLATPLSTEEAKSNYVIYATANTAGSAAVDIDIDVVLAPGA